MTSKAAQSALRILMLAVAGLLAISCSSEYDLNTDPDRYGNPGKDLVRTYSREFVVLEGQYFKVLDAFYSFTREHNYDEFKFGKCFHGFLSVLFEQSELPCIATYSSKGVPVKRHATLTFTKKVFYRHGGHDYLAYRIDLYDIKGVEASPTVSEQFAMQVEPKLFEFSSDASKFVNEPASH
jgi:hypothetical protein